MAYSNNKTPAGIAALILRMVVGAVFVYAAWLKLRDPWAMFAIAIDSYQVLPVWAVELVARTLPWFELLLGLVLMSGVWQRVSTACTSLLLLVFLGLMVRAMAKGMQIECGCFGSGEQISAWTLMRDGGLMAASLFVTWMAFRQAIRRPALPGDPRPPLRPPAGEPPVPVESYVPRGDPAGRE